MHHPVHSTVHYIVHDIVHCTYAYTYTYRGPHAGRALLTLTPTLTLTPILARTEVHTQAAPLLHLHLHLHLRLYLHVPRSTRRPRPSWPESLRSAWENASVHHRSRRPRTCHACMCVLRGMFTGCTRMQTERPCDALMYTCMYYYYYAHEHGEHARAPGGSARRVLVVVCLVELPGLVAQYLAVR